jgi:hypothetical protein
VFLVTLCHWNNVCALYECKIWDLFQPCMNANTTLSYQSNQQLQKKPCHIHQEYFHWLWYPTDKLFSRLFSRGFNLYSKKYVFYTLVFHVLILLFIKATQKIMWAIAITWCTLLSMIFTVNFQSFVPRPLGKLKTNKNVLIQIYSI